MTISHREIVIIILLCVTCLAYTLTVVYVPKLSKDALEILKYIAIAIVSYYLGTLSKKEEKCQCNIIPRTVIDIEHLKYLRNIGLIMLGFGIALVVQHVVLYGVDFSFISHEWVGLYVIIASLVILGFVKKLKGW